MHNTTGTHTITSTITGSRIIFTTELTDFMPVIITIMLKGNGFMQMLTFLVTYIEYMYGHMFATSTMVPETSIATCRYATTIITTLQHVNSTHIMRTNISHGAPMIYSTGRE